LWAIEIKRGLAAQVHRGFHTARGDLKPARSFVVHAGDDRFPLGKGIEAIGLLNMAHELEAMDRAM